MDGHSFVPNQIRAVLDALWDGYIPSIIIIVEWLGSPVEPGLITWINNKTSLLF
jgi:hypothetical protein